MRGIAFLLVVLALSTDSLRAQCDRIGVERQLSSSLVQSDFPAVVWTGSEYGVVWHQSNPFQPDEIYFIRLDPTGEAIGAPRQLNFNPGVSGEPHLVWNGGGYGVTWYDDDGSMRFLRLDAFGQPLSQVMAIPGTFATSVEHALVWTGSVYGLAWSNHVEGSNSEIFFARLDPSGARLGDVVRVTQGNSTSVLPSLAWSGSEFGLVWYDLRDLNLEIYFTRLDAMGLEIGDDIRLTSTPTDTADPHLVWNGSTYGVIWTDAPAAVYFARLNPSGVKIGTELRVTTAPSSSGNAELIWTGAEYGITWTDTRDNNAEIYLARVSAAGSKVGADLRLTSNSGFSYNPVITWSDREYGIAWADNTLGRGQIYFARIGCDSDCLEPSPEICDGVDNDCNGLVDDGLGPGTLSVGLEPPRLWPPNHRMVAIHATVTLSGGCPAACPAPPVVILASVSSDEPDDANGGGDGNTLNDIQDAAVGSADFDLELRAERDSDGAGRHYEVAYVATDCFGSAAAASATILVPHDENGAVEPVRISVTNSADGTLLAWDPVPGAVSYRVVRGNTASLRDAGEFIELGEVTCIRADSTVTATQGDEDAENPPLGQAFFYLVAYSDQWGGSGYGTAAVPKPRAAASGDCP